MNSYRIRCTIDVRFDSGDLDCIISTYCTTILLDFCGHVSILCESTSQRHDVSCSLLLIRCCSKTQFYQNNDYKKVLDREC